MFYKPNFRNQNHNNQNKMAQELNFSQWESLAGILRNEFQEYGGVFSLLQDQQKSIFDRNADLLFENNKAIEKQLKTATAMRQQREQKVRELAQQINEEAITTVKELMPFIPKQALPLMEALMNGAADLLKKIQDTTQKNRLLLARANELNDQILRMTRPLSMTKTYTANGNVSIKSLSLGENVQVSA